MADSLFDNRYRYDYIYPRGRSGETLRAVDTEANDRPVVIKRPALNDAPPIRAGQEVSILNERKALMRLEGHPATTEYLGSGQFFIGGMGHQYIVMERAEGVIIEEEVLALARNRERLPLLEMLVVLESLLDLLQKAHEKDIVYNDVDAKHLFWQRADYHLKVIDWGNAVFLEGDEITPQGISRQSDVYQVGELMFFIISGGRRAEIPRDADESFRLDFGDDVEYLDSTLQSIISKAAHPNIRHRYANIVDLRRDLTRYRQPIERERDAVVNRVIERLRYELSKNDLRGLLTTLEPALKSDPGYPNARRALNEIQERLRDLDVAADLDAALIYMRGNNWQRAINLLGELRSKAGPKTGATVELMQDCTLLVTDANLPQVPESVLEAFTRIYEGNFTGAAHLLMTTDHPDGAVRRLQWLMAERISSRVPDVLLLRPNLYRLELALSAVGGDGVNLSDARSLMNEINQLLDDMPGEYQTNLVQLRDGYRAVVDRLTTLNKLLSTVAAQQRLPNRQLPLSSLDRALNAAMALADNMHVIGKQATGSPREARLALDSSRVIDPVNSVWGSISTMLNNLYELLQTYQTYVPSADGSDLEGWLRAARTDLSPFVERLFDELLVAMVDGLSVAAENWTIYGEATVQGNRNRALTALNDAMQAVSTISPTLSGWLNQLRSVVDGTYYVERHAVFGGLGRALADGWESYDRGRLSEAERLAQQAQEIARNQAERSAADRLFTLADITREWVERSGIASPQRTAATLNAVEALYTEEERRYRDEFAAQMPSKDTYLRAMNKGVVETFGRASTPALRIFFFNSILLGALEAHDGNLEDASFWREVAVRALGEYGARQVATRALDDFVERRRALNTAAELLNRVNGKHALETSGETGASVIERTRRQLEDNAEARLLAPAMQGLRDLEVGLREWSAADFRSAGLKLDNTLNAIRDAEQSAGLDLSAWRAWVEELNAAAAELHTHARTMRQTIERRPTDPVPAVREAHRVIASRTTELLGPAYSATLRQWYDTYEDFLSVYTDSNLRRSARLERFNELFKAMFIDRHPAYPLYRAWYDVTDNAPEFPPPPTDDPTPRIAEEAATELNDVDENDDFAQSRYTEAAPNRPRNRRMTYLVVAFVLLLVAAMVGLAISNSGGDETDDTGGASAGQATNNVNPLALIVTQTFEAEQTAGAAGAAAVDADLTPVDTLAPEDLITPTLVTRTPIARPSATPTETSPPTATFTDAPPTQTQTPSITPTPSVTNTATSTPTPTNTLTPTLPPEGLRGSQDLLAALFRIPAEDAPWDEAVFGPGVDDNARRLASGDVTDAGEVQIPFTADLMQTFFGNEPASRLRRAEANLDFVTYDASTLEPDDVFFGLVLQSATNPDEEVGLYVQVATLNALNLFIREDGEVTFASQVSVNAPNLRVRLDRDPITGDVTIYYNDTVVGDGPIPLGLSDEPLIPVLFVGEGGIVLNVRAWRITLN